MLALKSNIILTVFLHVAIAQNFFSFKKACDYFKKNAPAGNVLFISNGDTALKGDFPHMVALWYNPDEDDRGSETPWKCGGTLISHRYILTAAHCLSQPHTIPPSKIRVGDLDLFSDIEEDDLQIAEYNIIEIRQHHLYNPRISLYNDIGLIKTDKVVTFGPSVYPACLQLNDLDNPVNVGLTISGWAPSSKRPITEQPLLWALVRFVEKDNCSSEFSRRAPERTKTIIPRGILSSMTCAASLPGRNTDTCSGDSGGPLSYIKETMHMVVGITSFGFQCGGDSSSLYTKVSYYAPWIEAIVWRNEDFENS